jgi:hypothetical protein
MTYRVKNKESRKSIPLLGIKFRSSSPQTAALLTQLQEYAHEKSIKMFPSFRVPFIFFYFVKSLPSSFSSFYRISSAQSCDVFTWQIWMLARTDEFTLGGGVGKIVSFTYDVCLA